MEKQNIEIKIGESYKICCPYIVGVCDTCFIIEVKNSADVDSIKSYLDSPRHTVTKL